MMCSVDDVYWRHRITDWVKAWFASSMCPGMVEKRSSCGITRRSRSISTPILRSNVFGQNADPVITFSEADMVRLSTTTRSEMGRRLALSCLLAIVCSWAQEKGVQGRQGGYVGPPKPLFLYAFFCD